MNAKPPTLVCVNFCADDPAPDGAPRTHIYLTDRALSPALRHEATQFLLGVLLAAVHYGAYGEVTLAFEGSDDPQDVFGQPQINAVGLAPAARHRLIYNLKRGGFGYRSLAFDFYSES